MGSLCLRSPEDDWIEEWSEVYLAEGAVVVAVVVVEGEEGLGGVWPWGKPK